MGVHDTDKYPEVKRLLGIPEDEPIFIIRGKDKAASDSVMTYADLAEEAGASEEFLLDVEKCAIEIKEWQNENPQLVKVPD